MSEIAEASPAARAAPARRTPRVQTRLSLLMLGTAVAFVCLFLALQSSQTRQLQRLFHDRAEQARATLARIVELRANGARVHTDDYTRWDDFVAFTRLPDAEWARVNLLESIHTFGLDAAWVLDARGDSIYAVNPSDDPRLAALPVPRERLSAAVLAKPIRHFFAKVPSGVLEIWSSSIHGSDDFARRTPASGYYVAARLWTAEHVASLGKDAGGETRLLAATAPPSDLLEIASGTIVLHEPLADLDGRPIGHLRFATVSETVPHALLSLRLSLVLMIAAGLGMLIAVWLAMARWVGRPLAAIGQALRREQPELLRASVRRNDEIGEVARLVDAFFAQRRSLIEAREAAEAAAVAKSQFLANISHELRTPMHGILSFSRFGLREAATAEPAELREHFAQIEECGNGLLNLLNDLLDLAKFDAGRMRYDFGEVSLEDVVHDVADEFTSLYHERGLAIEIVDDPALVPVCADRVKMIQVTRNLLSNAAKFTPEGGRVTVRTQRDGTVARVLVEDTGTGIPPDELELIFDKFAQSSRTSPRSGGTGLGLAICREIVDGHEGRIHAENRAEGGARFVIEIPIAGPASARSPAAENSRAAA